LLLSLQASETLSTKIFSKNFNKEKSTKIRKSENKKNKWHKNIEGKRKKIQLQN